MSRKEFFENLKAERTTYRDMIDFCCNGVILNNYILPELTAKGFYFEVENGVDYDEETDEYFDVYQYYIISGHDAEMLEEYTVTIYRVATESSDGEEAYLQYAAELH